MNGLDLQFSINADEWLYLNVRFSAFKYGISLAFCLTQWKLFYKLKPYSVLFVVGPFSLKLTDIKKVYEHVEKILKENKDKLHSES
jgi:hypothetical protein